MLKDIHEDRVKVRLEIRPDRIPNLKDLQESHDFLKMASAVLSEISSQRAVKAVEQLCKSKGFKNWKIDSFAEAVAANELIKKLDSACRLVTTLDNMAKRAEDPSYLGNIFVKANQAELVKRLESLPPFLIVKRNKNAEICDIQIDLPKHLRLDDPEWREKLNQLDKWIEDNKGPADQLTEELLRRNPEQFASYGNEEVLNGWYTQSWQDAKNAGWMPDASIKEHEDGLIHDRNGNLDLIIKQTTSPPPGDWHKFNRIYKRCELLKSEDKNGNQEFKMVTERSFYQIPFYGYQDLFGQALTKLRVEDKEWRSGDEWVLAIDGTGNPTPVKLRDVAIIMEQQEALHRTQQAIEVVMDVALVLEGGVQASQGLKLMWGSSSRTLAQLREGVKVMRPAAQAGLAAHAEFQQANKFLRTLELDNAAFRAVHNSLAFDANLKFWSGIEKLALGGSGFLLNSPGAHEIEGGNDLHHLRGKIFLCQIGYGLANAGLRQVGLFAAAPNAYPQVEAILSAERNARHLLEHGAESLAHSGFFLTQVPMGAILLKEIYGSYRHSELAGERDLVRDLINRYGKQNNNDKAAVLTANVDMQKFRSIEQVRESLPKVGPLSAKIDKIFSGIKELTASRPENNGNENSAEQKAWIAKRDEFIIEIVAPNFLMNDEQLKKYEMERARALPEAAERPALTNEQLHKIESTNQAGIFDADLRKAAAVALTILMRSEDGQFNSIKLGGAKLNPEAIFTRQLKPQDWQIERLAYPKSEFEFVKDYLKQIAFKPVLLPLNPPVNYEIPRVKISPADTRPELVQEILRDDLIKLFEIDLLKVASARTESEFSKVMTAGDLLCDLQADLHTYALALEQIIQKDELSEDLKIKAVARLADLAIILMDYEQRLAPDQLDQYRAQHVGAASADLLKFLLEWGSTSATNKFSDARMFALYCVFASERKFLGTDTDADMEIAGKIMSHDYKGLGDEVRKLFLAAAFSNDTKASDWEAKLPAIAILEKNPGQAAMRPEELREKLTAELVKCAESGRQLREPEAKYSRAEQFAILNASEIALSQLSGRVEYLGIKVPALEVLDRSADESMRKLALAFREGLLADLKSDTVDSVSSLLRISLLAKFYTNSRDCKECASISKLKNQSVAVLKNALTVVDPEQLSQEQLGMQKFLQENSNCREMALLALRDLHAGDCSFLAQAYFKKENESSASVRLAALKLLQANSKPQEFARMCQELVHIESEPAIALYLQSNCKMQVNDQIQSEVNAPQITERFKQPPSSEQIALKKFQEQMTFLKQHGIEAIEPNTRKRLFAEKGACPERS